jgi:hypothetical protein
MPKGRRKQPFPFFDKAKPIERLGMLKLGIFRKQRREE